MPQKLLLRRQPVVLLIALPGKDLLHEYIRVDQVGGQRPGESLDGSQLSRRPLRSLVAPQIDEPSDSPATAAQRLDKSCGRGVVLVVRMLFRLLNQPFDQHARL